MAFDINEWHRDQVSRLSSYQRHVGICVVPALVLGDGIKLSVQASMSHYSMPRQNYAWPYSSWEVMCLEDHPVDLPGVRGDPDDPIAYLPTDALNQFVDAHGGVKDDATPA